MSAEADSLARIAEALERIAPAPLQAPDFSAADAFVWHVSPDRLEPVPKVNRVALDLLVGIDRSRDTLLDNTRNFARGLPANNALLWGARGMGKSSLVKAVHAAVRAEGLPLKIVWALLTCATIWVLWTGIFLWLRRRGGEIDRRVDEIALGARKEMRA